MNELPLPDPPGLGPLLEALRGFPDLPLPVQIVLLFGAVVVLTLGSMFAWRVVRTVLGRSGR